MVRHNFWEGFVNFRDGHLILVHPTEYAVAVMNLGIYIIDLVQ